MDDEQWAITKLTWRTLYSGKLKRSLENIARVHILQEIKISTINVTQGYIPEAFRNRGITYFIYVCIDVLSNL
jgi:hypothetical protein